ncbi:MAG: hypothetical protein L3J31_06830 [Bacteroidales bacterium]|nr:hypothetical protein [Bacteroidales bacterium]MCF6342501.1 hypothetical protein [Bacteroidales bacterium]
MRLIFTFIAVLMFMSQSIGQNDGQFNRNHTGIHKVLLLEVLQTNSYTYLLVEENDSSQWLAVPKMVAETGETYYYQGGNEMRDFKSTTLNRTFESVIFLGGVVKAKSMGNKKSDAPSSKVKSDKIEVSVSPVEGSITIAELFSDKEKYAGKRVQIKGKVAQFSSGIMGKNWIHLQDGTDFEGKFDLVATTNMDAEVGDVVILEGKITLDKDFGYGYFYEVIMEESKIVQ